MSWPRLSAIAIAVLVSLLLHNVFGWEQGWALLLGLASLLVSFPVSTGIERGLADKRDLEESLEKHRDKGSAD